MTAEPGSWLLRARWAVPVLGPPIPDGAVCVNAARIAGVGRWRDLRSLPAARREDLGDGAICPGLVNAHCHLDYTDLAGKIPPPRSFAAWIQGIKGAKGLQTLDEVRAAWLTGAGMLLRNGVTTVGDIEAFPELQPELIRQAGLRLVSFLELIGIRPESSVEEALEGAAHWLRRVGADGVRAGLSPHAPYSTTPGLRIGCAELAARHAAPVAMHVAESVEEFDMFMSGNGPLIEWLARNGRSSVDCGDRSPVQVAAAAGLVRRGFLAVHANYLTPGDVTLLASAGASVAHCPRSHAYFGHQPFPWSELRRAGVNVCLATDSLATVRTSGRAAPELDLFAEARAFHAVHPGVSPDELLGLLTIRGAAALGLAGRVGALREGAAADLIVLPVPPAASSPVEAIVSGEISPIATMVGGHWAWRKGDL